MAVILPGTNNGSLKSGTGVPGTSLWQSGNRVIGRGPGLKRADFGGNP